MTQVKHRKRYIACFAGITITLALMMAFVLAIPIFILNEYFPMEYTRGIIIILIGLSVFVGSVTTGCLGGNKGEGKLVLIGVLYYMPIIFASVFVYDGLTVFNIYGILASLAGSILAWSLLNKPKKQRIKRRKRGGNG